MKISHVLLTALIAATTLTGLTGCIDTDKPANYPPSMSMERDSMPDNLDKAEQEKEQNKN
ncbi:hypothetical protein ABO04_00170 [Nitrosomonas sp. HPC101]|uniref:hypothetical protein n=1 Tax=Nitrosomonas sp. HPC101 TaxID=1658667 RepID=UPI00137207B8|nr:hypothetical protein [Nitrosomonas sp. HPC101]MXS84367.1 hypothetical protein [Nitrosomonas sp. HPC101]